jgi:hypothetical protein
MRVFTATTALGLVLIVMLQVCATFSKPPFGRSAKGHDGRIQRNEGEDRYGFHVMAASKDTPARDRNLKYGILGAVGITSVALLTQVFAPMYITAADIPRRVLEGQTIIRGKVVSVYDGDTYRIRHMPSIFSSPDFKGPLSKNTIQVCTHLYQANAAMTDVPIRHTLESLFRVFNIFSTYAHFPCQFICDAICRCVLLQSTPQRWRSSARRASPSPRKQKSSQKVDYLAKL